MDKLITDCTLLILAGGNSRRMGQDKAELALAGSSLLQRVETRLSPLFSKRLLSVRQLRSGLALPQVADVQANSGPLAGLVSGMAQIDTPWLFMIATDMPFIRPQLVRTLAAFRRQQQAVIPFVDGHPQPLAGFYHCGALAYWQQQLDRQCLSLRRGLQALDVCYVNQDRLRVGDATLSSFFDLDTPDDLASAQQLLIS